MNTRFEQAPISIPVFCVDAKYVESELPDYRSNPLVEALPPISDPGRLLKVLANRPAYDEGERQLPQHLRAHCVLRLSDYFEPLGRHVELARRIDLILRDAYKVRNPRGPAYRARLQEIYERSQQKGNRMSALDVPAPGTSISLIGVSGTGKTRSLRRCLAQYPQVIWHPEHKIYQISWLIVECPHDGSVKALCLSFFQQIDKLLGTNYAKRFGGREVSAETRVLELAQIARLHCIGVIVLDELQHIRPAGPDGVEKMMNFFVTLVNLSEAAIVLVGTMAARELLQRDFRQARRGAGLGALVWPRYERDAEWDFLIGQLWKYQWTKKVTPISDDIKEAFYELTQGIVDLAVKLYILSQFRAMATRVEEVTPELMRQVAAEDFALLAPMLTALRSGNPIEIAKFDDLKPLDFELILAREQSLMDGDVDVETLRQCAEDDELVRRNQAIAAITTLGVPADTAAAAVTTVFTAHAELTAAQAVAMVLKSFKPRRAKAPSRPSAKKQDGQLSSGDIRRLVADGKAQGRKAGDSLAAAGLAIDVSQHVGL